MHSASAPEHRPPLVSYAQNNEDVILARERPEGLSALNILPVTVTEVKVSEGPGAVVQLRVGQDLLLARITRRSAVALGLKPGIAAHAVLKSVALAKSDIGAPHAERNADRFLSEP